MRGALFAWLFMLALAPVNEVPAPRAEAPSTALSPRIEAPESVLADNPLHFHVSGLTPGGVFTLQAEFATRAGTIWRSTATFTATEQGMIDPAMQAPTAGSYHTADAIGLLWSMTETSDRQTDWSLLENDDRATVVLSLHAGDRSLASHQVVFLRRAAGISSTDLLTPIVGTLYAPYHAHRLPAVVVLGGSEGGIPRAEAALIASHGFVALALGYFGCADLPRELDRIPVERVTRAVDWLKRQPEVDGRRIGIVGSSKGAELALLAASHDASLSAVVAIAPSSVAFQSLRQDHAQTSSWTWQDKEVPFAPFVIGREFRQSHRLVDLHRPSLAAAPAAAALHIERIGGPVLLLSGRQDALWPSAVMADQLEARNRAQHGHASIENLQYDDAGHHVAHIPQRPTGDSVRLGGSAAGLAHAQLQSWKSLIAFLERALGKPRQAAGRRLAPNQAIAQNLPPALAESIPNLPGVAEGKTVAVVCSGFTCQPPVSDPQELERLLRQHLTSKCG